MTRPRKHQLDPLANVLQGVLASGNSPLSDQFLCWRLRRDWSKIVGQNLGATCEPIHYERGRLSVWVSSSPRLQEIRFFSKTLRERVNEHLGREWCTKISFTLNRRGRDGSSDLEHRAADLFQSK